ncbi:MAG: J domain-containing protein [Planctomycetes bacterium]|nr:J domain-containing protein [Planctomycetota bacterium]MBL7044299.1 J domain-containing protein [Pirellulaceae bacterium]
MADPYLTLGLSADVDEATVRRRYLELVRENPPEKCPERFAEVREAYEQLRDPVTLLRKEIFRIRGRESLDDIIADLRSRVRAVRIPTETLLSLAEG